MTKLRIALAQIEPISATPLTALDDGLRTSPPTLFAALEANLRLVMDHVRKASAEGADLVVFPEYFLQGILNEKRQYLSLPSRHLEAFISGLAEEFGVGIAGSIIHGELSSNSALPTPPSQSPFSHITSGSTSTSNNAGKGADESRDGRAIWAEYLSKIKETLLHDDGPKPHLRLLNEAVLFDKQGKSCGRYIKRNLWHPEREYLAPGNDKGQVFDTPFGRIGFLICWDLSHPGAAQNLADQGADLIIMPSYWLGIDSEPMLSKHNADRNYELHVVQSLAYARAFETETVLAMVNAGGNREKDGFMGGSGVWAPLLGRIGGFDGEEVGMKVLDVDLGVLKDARETYKIREDWSEQEVR